MSLHSVMQKHMFHAITQEQKGSLWPYSTMSDPESVTLILGDHLETFLIVEIFRSAD